MFSFAFIQHSTDHAFTVKLLRCRKSRHWIPSADKDGDQVLVLSTLYETSIPPHSNLNVRAQEKGACRGLLAFFRSNKDAFRILSLPSRTPPQAGFAFCRDPKLLRRGLYFVPRKNVNRLRARSRAVGACAHIRLQADVGRQGNVA